ncbi:hypothetical protein [Actinoplanes couchii]|nr:hypothetical protein [Actinoplanes couchii]MDR6323083.1 hypothetical protein [Actinoplanes couchii]
MADQQPGDNTTAAGMSDPTRNAGAGEGEPPTAALPGRWSGAAPVPARGGPRRSRWSRVRDRFAGTEGQGTDVDDRTTVPAVDPWADQDTPAWPAAWTTPAADPTLFDGPAERTLFETSPSPAPSRAAAAGAGAADRTLFETEPAGADRTLFETAPAATPAPSEPAAEPARPSLLERVKRETERLRKEAAAAAREPVNPAPAPPAPPAPAPPVGPPAGTYPPPAGGTGLPPRVRPKWQVWGQRAAETGRQAATEAPERLRSWSQQAGTLGQQAGDKGRQAAEKSRQAVAETPAKLRSWRRKPAPETAAPPRIPVQPRPAARPWTPPPPRKRRRFRRLVLVVAVVIALFTVGPYVQPHIPVLNQYPVTAILPDDFSDLTLRDTAAGRQAAQKLAEQLQEAGSGTDTFAGIYGDGKGKRVTVFGVTGLRLTPGSDVESQLARLAGSLKLTDVRPVETGVFGVHQQCGTGRLDGTSVVACAWADHGSLATVLLTRRNVAESAELVAELRTRVLTTTSPLV